MDAAKESIVQSIADLRTKLDGSPFLQKFEEKTKCPKEYFVIFMSLILALAFLAGIGAVVMCNIIGFIFPAIKSIKAIETHASTEVTQWLVYWVVYASFSVIEIFADTLTYWIPFYYRFKLGFLLWAMLPQTRGAKYLYDHILRDFLKLSTSKVENAVKKAKANNEDNAAPAEENKKDE